MNPDQKAQLAQLLTQLAAAVGTTAQLITGEDEQPPQQPGEAGPQPAGDQAHGGEPQPARPQPARPQDVRRR